ncbi:MAG: hypothetical protein SFV17_11105 [Candidatus Obscuribacter sp.]|nr:hypothetical protein [Candidatus Obscuribacter sp.]
MYEGLLFIASSLVICQSAAPSAAPGGAGTLNGPYSSAFGPSLPGGDNGARWHLVGEKLEALCRAQRKDVHDILGVTERSWQNAEKLPVWRFNIEVNKNMCSVELYQLILHFEKDRVASVTVERKTAELLPPLAR